MHCSLIISVYNDIKFLTLIFEALKIQTEKNFEVIIADDGSNEDAVAAIKKLISNTPLKVKHVWHRDEGWRKNIILNKAIEASESDYLIFLDGDCIPHPKFVAEHLRFAIPGKVVGGRRVQLSRSLTEEITPELIASGKLHSYILPRILMAGIRHEERHAEECLRLTDGFLRHLFLNERWHDLLGCNFSIFKEDIMKVNGFDERFRLPATGEDTDLEARLNRIGIYCKVERHIMTVYHKKHIRKEYEKNTNIPLFDENNSKNISWTPYGISKNLPQE